MSHVISALTMTVAVMVGIAAAEPLSPKEDRQGPVTVSVAVLPAGAGDPLRIKVVLDTHAGSLDRVAFEDAVGLRVAEGRDLPAVSIEQVTGSGHHREAVLVFAAVADGEPIRIVVKNVGGVRERVFEWERAAR